jgi:hypothetical protein
MENINMDHWKIVRERERLSRLTLGNVKRPWLAFAMLKLLYLIRFDSSFRRC